MDRRPAWRSAKRPARTTTVPVEKALEQLRRLARPAAHLQVHQRHAGRCPMLADEVAVIAKRQEGQRQNGERDGQGTQGEEGSHGKQTGQTIQAGTLIAKTRREVTPS